MYIRTSLCSIEEDSIKDFQAILGSEDDDLDKKRDKEIKVEDPEKEDKEEEEDLDEDEEEKDPDEDKNEYKDKEDKEGEKENLSKSVEIPHIKEINKKYPNLFKDFPHLRHTFFHAKAYREIFPSVEEAKEASEQLENFSSLQASLNSGTAEDVVNVLKSMKEIGEDVISNFSDNFLGGIKELDQKLYYRVITPELVNLTRSVYNAGIRNENDNLKNSAMVIAQHLFGDPKVASGDKEVKIAGREEKKDNSVDKEKIAWKNERYSTFYNDVVVDSDSRLENLISDGIDPKDLLSKGMKSVIIEKTAKEISRILSDDPSHKSRMNSLWKKASTDNFITAHKSKIISAYIEAAKDLIPRVRSRIKADILGTRDRHSDDRTPGGNGKNRRVEPPNNTGGGRRQSSKDIDSKKIDYSKTSDLDIMNDRVTVKN